MRFHFWLLFLGGLLFSHAALSHVQSVFEGPVRLKVWQHWQQSWNVERDESYAPQFRLERGLSEGNVGQATLIFHRAEKEAVASLSCEGLERNGEWEVTLKSSPQISAKGQTKGDNTFFSFEDASSCVDMDQTRIVSKIRLQIFNARQKLFETEVIPMYLRGKGQSYYNNSTDPFMAHAGKGDLKISGLMKAEDKKNDKHWDVWNGVLVKPILEFVDRNTLGKGAEIGLHRHETNQEAYYLESGRGEMWMGRVPFDGKSYFTKRKFNGQGEERSVKEFSAEGGWIEKRELLPGQISVIVPKPQEAGDLAKEIPGFVSFHGFKAMEPTVFWTMGSKN